MSGNWLKNAKTGAVINSQIQFQSVIHKIDDLNKEQDKKSVDDQAKCKLASVYRLVDLKGWSESIYNHITVYHINQYVIIKNFKCFFVYVIYLD